MAPGASSCSQNLSHENIYLFLPCWTAFMLMTENVGPVTNGCLQTHAYEVI
jgi:hypothetical protein